MLKNKEWLQECYLEKGMTGQAIADIVGCSKCTVYRRLNAHGIKRRGHTSKYPQLNDKEWLEDAYVNQGRSLNSIANEVGSTPGNIGDHLDVMGISRRTVKAALSLKYPNGLKGELASNWKGGKVNKSGYVYIQAPDHPYCTKLGYVMEHRLLAEQALGRFLKKDEIVHHIDGDKANNDIENLEVLTRSEHVMRHFEAVKRVRELEAEIKRLKEALALKGQ